jgi:SRSO17 transposase
MDLATIIDGADRFVAYVEELTSVIGHADRALPLRDYCAGLLTAEGRKSVEPMAAVTAPAQVSAAKESGRTKTKFATRNLPTPPRGRMPRRIS